MLKTVQAVYQDGNLILSEKLGSEMEGKRFKVIILDADQVETQRGNFFKLVDKHAFLLPENYKFNRDELYDR